MKREHIVPLARQAVAVLRELRALPGSEASPFLFPSPSREGYMSNNTMLYALYRMGYHGRATITAPIAMVNATLPARHRAAHHRQEGRLRPGAQRAIKGPCARMSRCSPPSRTMASRTQRSAGIRPSTAITAASCDPRPRLAQGAPRLAGIARRRHGREHARNRRQNRARDPLLHHLARPTRRPPLPLRKPTTEPRPHRVGKGSGTRKDDRPNEEEGPGGRARSAITMDRGRIVL